MLKMKKKVTLTGESVIDGVSAEGYSATIDTENPEDINMSSWRTNTTVYKENRAQCRKDAADFEDAAYLLQDEMIYEAELSTEETN